MLMEPDPSPLISIIALCYNHSAYLRETLDSILAQSYPNKELIIMDDCSSDDSVQLINQWIYEKNIECTFIPHKKNKGICPTLNEALSHCSGEYIQIIACDDVLLPQKLEIQLNTFLKGEEGLAVVFSDAYLVNHEGEKYPYTNIEKSIGKPLGAEQMDIYGALLEGNNFIPAGSALIRSQVYEEVGYYDENLTYEDLDMWLRISKKFPFAFSDYISVHYRWHGENLSKKLYKNFEHLKSRYLIYRKHYYNDKPSRRLIEKKLFSAINGMQNISVKKSLPYILDFFLTTWDFGSLARILKKSLIRTLKFN